MPFTFTPDAAEESGFRFIPDEESTAPEGREESEPAGSGYLRRFLGDPALSLLKGAIRLPEAAVGILDIPTGGGVGQFLEAGGYGFQPKAAREAIDTWFSPEQQAANQQVQAAEGFIPTLKAAASNPSTIAHTVLESVPSLLGGATVARGLLSAAPRLGALAAGAVGEGVVGAGISAEETRQSTESGLLTPEQSALAATSGAVTGLLGVLGGRLARKLGIADIDSALAGAATPASKSSRFTDMLKSAGAESIFEELPQSAQERISQNIALGKPWGEGVGGEAAMGALAGGVAGGAAPLISSTRPSVPPKAAELFARTERTLPRSTEAARAIAEKPIEVLTRAQLDAKFGVTDSQGLAELQRKTPETKATPAIENLALVSESNLGRAKEGGDVPAMILPDGTALIGESHPTIIAKYETLNPEASTEGAVSGFIKADGTFRSSLGWPELTSPIKRVQRPQADLRGPVPTEPRDIQTVESELRGFRSLADGVKRDAEHEHYFQRLEELEAELGRATPISETIGGKAGEQSKTETSQPGVTPPADSAPLAETVNLNNRDSINGWWAKVKKAIESKDEAAAAKLVGELPAIKSAPEFQGTLFALTSPSRIGSTFIDKLPTADGSPLWKWRNELQSKEKGGVANEKVQGQVQKEAQEILTAESGQQSPPQETAPSLVPEEATTATPVAGSSQSLGIVPPGTQQLQSIIDAAIAKPQGMDSPVRTDVTTPLPDFQPHANSKKIFSQPFGFERLPVLGALWGGLRRLKGNVNEAITAYHGERNVGRAVASSLAQEYSWLKKPFTIKDGQIANIGAAEGQSRYISDVFEALQRDPNAYTLSAEQRAAFDAMQKLEGDFKSLEQKYGLSKAIEEEGGVGTEGGEGRSYFPRVVVEAPEGRGRTLGTGAKVGGKAFFEKSRLFETEAEGWQKGWKYEEDITRRIATRAERLYKRIADKRLADDPTLGGLSRKELDAQLKDGYAEELASGEITEAKLQQIGDSIEQQGRVWQPQFFNKIFPRETAEAMNKAFPQTQSGLRSMAANVNNALKGLWLGFDLGAGFIQGQGTMFYQPKVWAKAQVNSLKSMVSPEFFPEYVRQNLEPVREAAQLGMTVGRMEEMLAGAERGELLQRIPGVKQTLGRAIQPFARQFQTFIDTAKIELWKGLRETTPKAEWPRVIQSIESILSTSRMEPVGIGAGRALAERALLIAPSYYRGALNLVAGMGEKGVSGQVARRAMGAYMAGGALLYYGIGKALGMSDEDLQKRFDPRRSDFMLWRVKTGERTTEIGFGGIFKSLMKLGGNIVKTSIENPENWKSLSPEKNPITRWYRAHAGPVVGLTFDQLFGKDFMGKEVDLGNLSKVPLPMVARTAMTEGQRFSPLDTAATFAGLTAFERTNPSSQEINKLASAYRKKAGLPDTSDFVATETPARRVREALQQRDTKAAMAELQELRKTKKDTDIFKGFQQSRARAFTGSAEREGKFKASLTPQQRALYDSAKAEKERDYQAFLDLWRNKPPRP